MAENPGNGRESPFGNGAGATPSGPSSGGNNFLTNPAGNGSKGGGRDFSAERPAPQPTGPGGLNMDSVPAGGRLPFSSNTSREVYNKPGDGTKKPFKLQGEQVGSTAEPDYTGVEAVDNSITLLGQERDEPDHSRRYTHSSSSG